MRQPTASVGFALLGISLLGPSHLAAQGKSLRESLPANTLLYFSVPDLEKSFEEFKSAPLYKIWKEEEVQEFVKQPLAKAKEEIDKHLAQAREQFKAGKIPIDPDEVLKLRLKGFSIALSDVALPAEGQAPSVGLVIGLDFGASQPSWRKLIDGMLDMAKQSGEGMPEIAKAKVGAAEMNTLRPPGAPPFFSFNWGWIGSQLILSLSDETLRNILETMDGKAGQKPLLAKDAAFVKCFSKFKLGSSASEFFVRPGGMFKLAVGGLQLAASMNPNFPEEISVEGIKRAIDALGLFGVEAIAGVGGYKDGHGVSESYSWVPAENRKGLLALESGKPLDLKKVSLVPKDATAFTYSRLGLAGLYDVLVGALTAYDKDLSEQLLAQAKQFEEKIGVNIKEDLFAQIGDEILSYSMKPGGMMAAPEMGIILPLKDGQRFVKCLKSLSSLTNGAVVLSEKPDQSNKELVIYTVDLDIPLEGMGGGGMNPLAMFSPSFAIHQGHLVVAFNRSDVKRAIKRFSATEGGDVTSAPSFQPHKAVLKMDGLTSVSFQDWPPVFDAIYTQLTGMAALVPIPEEVPIDLSILPTAEAFTKHLESALSYSTSDKDGYYTFSQSPFGPEVLAGAAIAAAGVGGGMAAMQMRRGEARGHAVRARRAAEKKAEEEESEQGEKPPPPPKKKGG